MAADAPALPELAPGAAAGAAAGSLPASPLGAPAGKAGEAPVAAPPASPTATRAFGPTTLAGAARVAGAGAKGGQAAACIARARLLGLPAPVVVGGAASARSARTPRELAFGRGEGRIWLREPVRGEGERVLRRVCAT